MFFTAKGVQYMSSGLKNPNALQGLFPKMAPYGFTCPRQVNHAQGRQTRGPSKYPSFHPPQHMSTQSSRATPSGKADKEEDKTK